MYRYAMRARGTLLRVRLLGPLEVAVGERPVVVDTRKALAIVALVAAEGRPFARDELAVMFWPEADDESARGALRRTLSSLRTAIGPVGLMIDRSQVALDPDASAVDLVEFERLAASDDPTALEAAAALARGPFMAGFALRDSPDFDDWQAARAVRAERLVGDVLDRLAAARSHGGDQSGAIDIARRRVALDPLDEPGQRRVMELLARSGDRSGAIRQYRALVALFDRELGVAPLRETTDLYEAIREDRILPSALADVPDKPSGSVATGVARDASATLDASPRDVPLVGRARELEAIDDVWRATSPDGRVVLLEGEAGIGKTRLAEAVAASVAAAGGVVLAARGYPGEGAIAYGPLAESLRTGLALRDGPARLATLDETARAEIGRLVDLPSELRPVHPATTVPDSVGARVRLLEAVAGALAALTAGPIPGLLWVDDLHLADEPTREALAYLARRLRGRPMLLLLAWRREDLGQAAEATAADLARLPAATSIALERLDRDGIATIVRAMRPDDADDALIDAFAADSEGLPLHVVAALASGEAPGQAMPRSVQALLQERISSVSETAAQILSAAAIIGRSFDLGIVRQASGRSEEETIEAVEELTRRGLVREVPGVTAASIRYDFSHGRIREVAYEATGLARRRLIHRRTADALRLDPIAGGRDDLARFALIAGHEREAGRASEAAAAFLAAADRAESVFANREAIEYLDAAIALADPAADAAAAHARIGELRSRLGEYPAALAALETAAALADPTDLPAFEIALGRVQRRRGDLDAAASHLASALASADLTPTLRARALVERSIVALRAGDLDHARRSAAQAGDVATSIDDPRLEGVAERLVGLVAQATGDLPTARAALERSLAIAADDPDPTAAIAAETGLALVLAASGAVDDAIAIAGSAIAACQRIGDRHLEAAVENHLADMLHDAGRPAASMDHLKRAVALFAEVGEGVPERDPGIWALAAW
jgi:DNA-binding SARP family transcriptional activator/tetratricopeptide (TPR) repeat protein